jgi:hypothetical protein
MANRTAGAGPTAVYLEAGTKRVFACALDWPGWCRSGKTEEQALETLAAYVPRFAVVAKEAGVPFPDTAGDAFDVVERVPGSASTDFGMPAELAAGDAEPVSRAEAARATALVRASWELFDRVAATAPAELRKGPRGGGRDRDKMIGHVIGAEAAYARKLGVKHKPPGMEDSEAVGALRAAIAGLLAEPSAGGPLAEKGWPHRYAARRIAWHVLDHLWEMEDRSEPAG